MPDPILIRAREFNDDPETTHKDVLRVLDQAIAE